MNKTQINQTVAIIDSYEVAMPSLTVKQNDTFRIENSLQDTEHTNEAVSVVLDGTNESIATSDSNQFQPAKYARNLTLESVVDDQVPIVPKSLNEYTDLFKKAEELSAREILTMCRIVYEAHKTLNSAEFHEFCKAIGYKDDSSAIRKKIVIGKLQPRLIMHAEALPANWTGIYAITQIPAQVFENLMHLNRSFKEMPASKIQELVKEARDLNKVGLLVAPTTLTLDEQKREVLKGTAIAKIYFSKIPDDLDWSAFEKALREVEAHLPVKIQFTTTIKELFEMRKLVRYEKIKSKQAPKIFKPETWDMGWNVNAMNTASMNDVISSNTEKHAA